MTDKKRDILLDEAFNECVDLIRDNKATLGDCLNRYPDLKKDLEPALRAALSMTNGPAVAPDEAFRARVKENLVTTRAPGTKRAFRPKAFIFRVMAATIAFALLLSGVGYASTDSMPDDFLYPVKQLIEKIRLATTPGNEAQVELLLQLAEERLKEADTMAEEGKTEEAREALNDLMKDMHDAYKAAGMVPGHDREILLAKFAVISQRHMLVLEGVLARAPESAKPAIEKAIENSASGLDKASEAVMKEKKGKGGNEEGDEDEITDGDETVTEGFETSSGQGQGQGQGNNKNQNNNGKGKNK